MYHDLFFLYHPYGVHVSYILKNRGFSRFALYTPA